MLGQAGGTGMAEVDMGYHIRSRILRWLRYKVEGYDICIFVFLSVF